MHALPHEMLSIGGAALGSLIIGNSGADLKALAGGLGKVFKGPQYKKQDYLDCILLVSSLMKMMRTEGRSEEHTSELQSLMRISYAVFCLKKKNTEKLKMQIKTRANIH